MIENYTNNLFEELWKIDPSASVFAVIYIIGLNISLYIWWRKNINLPNWLYWTALWVFDVKTLRKVFLQGPGVLLIFIWMIVAGIAMSYMSYHVWSTLKKVCC